MSDKVKYELEFVIKSSSRLLFNYLATPSGLSQWFAENVNSRGEIFTFIWDGSEEEAKLISKKANQFIKFKWLADEDDESYFEFKIQIDDITKDLSLIITDFAEEDELEEAKLLWESQVEDLHSILGG
ncbi:MAG: START-like domain-containing protein [Vicingaceae bacterium]|nr:START-like domain-containing protein [Vicingaceae bacterium]